MSFAHLLIAIYHREHCAALWQRFLKARIFGQKSTKIFFKKIITIFINKLFSFLLSYFTFNFTSFNWIFLKIIRKRLIFVLFFRKFDFKLGSEPFSKIFKIISQILLPFMVEKYDLDCYLHQDNDRKHTARLNQKLLEDLGIIWVKIHSFQTKY